MEQRQAVRIPVQLRARLLHDDGGLDPAIECGCSEAVHHGSHTHGVRANGSGLLLLAIDGLVDDLSRTGMFLRTPQSLPPGTSATVCLELPGEQVTLRGQVVRIERGARAGLGLQFAGEQPSRRLLVNYLMRCHAQGG
jgi:hypothetical protein